MRDAIGIEAVNSVDFVRRIISLFDDNVTAATFRNASDKARLSELGFDRFISPLPDKGWGRLDFTPADGDDIAQVIFTSGTTGEPKAIALSKTNVSNTIRRLNSVMNVDSSIREYVGVPVTYSFGLARARAVAAAGGEFFIPQNGFAPLEIAQMLQRGEINAISAVPTLWRILLQNADLFGTEANSLKWIEIGSQSMARTEKEALKSLFPNAAIIQHYGLTEASRTTFLKIHKATGEYLDSVGEAAAPIEIKTDDRGRIMIRGPHIARNEIRKNGIVALTDAEGWLTTNDAGEIKNGNLYFNGRLDDLINCSGVKINPETLEVDLASALGAKADEIAVARLPDSMRGDGILLAIHANAAFDDESARSAALAAISASGLNAAGAVKIARMEQFARTETGKLQRHVIAEQYLAADSETPQSAGDPHAQSMEDSLISLWKHALGGKHISSSDSFFDVGGDLRAAEELIPQMEAVGVPSLVAREMLDGLSIAEIARLSRAGAAKDPAAELEEKILTVWREALGRDDVSVDESFYDIGGDSLSAVTVALNLERAGLDPNLAHGVFDGKTIRELSREFASGHDDIAEIQTIIPKKTEIAVFSEASNFMKGVVLLCMISSHWAPYYLERLGLDDGPVASFMALFFSLGTPTLAFMFGMGIAVFHARQFHKSRPSFNRNIKIAVALLAAGVVINGLLENLGAIANGVQLGLTGVIDRFYGPFIYFLVATASLPFWVGKIGNGPKSVISLLLAAAIGYASYGALTFMLEEPIRDQHSLLHALAVGRWSILQMGAISLFGAAGGILIQNRLESGGDLRPFGVAGLSMIAGSLLASIATGSSGIWFEFPKQISLFTMFFYAGIALCVISAFRTLTSATSGVRSLRRTIEITSCIGILLFPLFVLQSFVYRAARIWFDLTGHSFLTVLTLMIICFALISALLIKRVYKIYYAGRL